MLDVRSGIKSYGGREILNIPSLRLNRGIYWLRGQNGSGKTTLLRMIAGLIPFSGDILHSGISLKQNPLLYRRQLSWAEAEPVYPDFLSAADLIAFYRQLKKASSAQTEKLISLFGMEPHAGATIGSFSSGMVKRLSLLLAFLGSPTLILLDEPLATLDAEAAALLPRLILDQQRDHGSSFIFSSHQPFKTTSLPIDAELLLTGGSIQPSA